MLCCRPAGTVRNYGALVNNIGSIGTKAAPISNPFASNVIQVAELRPSLVPFTGVYTRRIGRESWPVSTSRMQIAFR
jgi:hypothetical protein